MAATQNLEQIFEKQISEIEKGINTRLTRIESRLVRGFEELGVDTTSRNDLLEVDDAARVVHLKTLGRSLKVILQAMVDNGATRYGESYRLVHSDLTVGSIRLLDIS